MEARRGKLIVGTILNRPYSDVIDKIPVEYQVSYVPRIIYVAVRYHLECLTDTAARASFEKYNVKAIADHIGDEHNRYICDAIVTLLPTGRNKSVIAILQLVSVEQADIYLAGMDAAQMETIYRHLISYDNPGQWAFIQTEVRVSKKASSLKKLLIDEAQKIHQTKVSQLLASATNEINQEK